MPLFKIDPVAVAGARGAVPQIDADLSSSPYYKFSRGALRGSVWFVIPNEPLLRARDLGVPISRWRAKGTHPYPN